ncbi:MAG: hypothetical protein AB8G05_11945 [Oligoflexales bacterium]
MNPLKIIFMIILALASSRISYATDWRSIFALNSRPAKIFERICKDKEEFPIDQQLIVEKILGDAKITISSPEDCYPAWKKVKILKNLNLSELNLSSIEVLRDFKLLKELDLSNNYIHDASPLKNMKKLKSLDLSNNCLSDTNSFSHLKLKFLNLNDNIIDPNTQKIFTEVTNASLNLNISNQHPNKANCSRQNDLPNENFPGPAKDLIDAKPKDDEHTLASSYVEDIKLIQEQSVSSEYMADPNIIDELLLKLREYQVALVDVIMLEEITDSISLFEAFSNLGLTNINQDTVIQSLFTFLGLLEDLENSIPNLRISPFRDYHSSDLPLNILKQYRFNPSLLQYSSQTTPYKQRLQELKNTSYYKENYYADFYRKITKKVFEEAVYPNGEDRILEYKKSDLILLLASIKNENCGSADQRSLSWNLKAIEREPFTTRGQPDTWFEELQYKLFKLYEKYDDLPYDKQVLLLSYLLHGGRHCSDAKWNAINGAFMSFCPDAAREIQESHIAGGSFRQVNNAILNHLNILKTEMLTKFINTYIEEKSEYREETCTYFNTTWDQLAPQIGLNTLGSRYSAYLIRQASADFPQKYYDLFTPQMLYKAASEDLLRIIRKSYLGPLSQLIPNQEFLLISLFRYYEAIY